VNVVISQEIVDVNEETIEEADVTDVTIEEETDLEIDPVIDHAIDVAVAEVMIEDVMIEIAEETDVIQEVHQIIHVPNLDQDQVIRKS